VVCLLALNHLDAARSKKKNKKFSQPTLPPRLAKPAEYPCHKTSFIKLQVAPKRRFQIMNKLD
jgi:hypothetical protein